MAGGAAAEDTDHSDDGSASEEDGSDSDAELVESTCLDAETEALVRSAPLQAQIGEALEMSVRTLPQEVKEFFAARGSIVTAEKLLKVSFHVTFRVDLSRALVSDGRCFSVVVVQVLGAELGDKALFGRLGASSLMRAAELAASAGVRVPKIIGHGQCENELLGKLDFVVQEHIQTHTVEDRVRAPDAEWSRLVGVVTAILAAAPLGVDMSAAPLPHFRCLATQLQWLMTLVPCWDEDLREALSTFSLDVLASRLVGTAPILLHQDLNGGNVLTSPAQGGGAKWALDAVIDWESAAVSDPRTLDDADPWRTTRQLALVTKGAMLAESFAREMLPRCELLELVECYEKAARALDESGWLCYRPWAERVKLAQARMSITIVRQGLGVRQRTCPGGVKFAT